MTGLLVAVGSGVGALLRWLVAGRLDARWPRGTLLVNLVGSLLAGALLGAGVGGDTGALLVVGVCGGLTTWSGLAVGTVDLAGTDGAGGRRAASYAVGTVVLGVLAAALGWWLGSLR